MMKTLLLLPVLCALFVGSAATQTVFMEATTVDVPFDFVVNHTTLPAGKYVVSVNTDGRRLIIQNKTEPRYGIFLVNNNISVAESQIQNQSKMVFAINDGKHVLHQVYLAGDNHIHDILHRNDVIELAPTR